MRGACEKEEPFKGDVNDGDNVGKIAAAVRTILECLGEDADREGLVDTPMRAAKALAFFTSGYKKTLADVVGQGVFADGVPNNMVLVKDMDVHSLCEHHMIPFTGKVHIAYITGPDGLVLGLSKLSRIVDLYARRLQVQERLTSQIAAAVQEAVQASGVAVFIESSHMCMVMRGVEQVGSSTSTTCYLGAFKRSELSADNGAASFHLRSEFLQLIARPSLSKRQETFESHPAAVGSTGGLSSSLTSAICCPCDDDSTPDVTHS